VDVTLIAVPYVAGDDRHGASEGPRRLLAGGAELLLAEQGLGVATETIERGEPFRDTASSSAAVNRRLAQTVRAAVEAERLPLVVAGSCAAAPGVLSGFDHARAGIVWLDAHADFNTPESTASGFFPGMSLAVLTGHCYRSYWAQVGDSMPIPEHAVVLVGVRDLSPEAERDRVESSAIRLVAPDDVGGALDALAGCVDEIYVHVDFDVFDPDVAPGIVDEPVPGGLSLREVRQTIEAAAARFRVRAVTLATFNPARDRGDTTLRVALELVGIVGGIAARQ
jgi:arginase